METGGTDGVSDAVRKLDGESGSSKSTLMVRQFTLAIASWYLKFRTGARSGTAVEIELSQPRKILDEGLHNHDLPRFHHES